MTVCGSVATEAAQGRDAHSITSGGFIAYHYVLLREGSYASRISRNAGFRNCLWKLPFVCMDERIAFDSLCIRVAGGGLGLAFIANLLSGLNMKLSGVLAVLKRQGYPLCFHADCHAFASGEEALKDLTDVTSGPYELFETVMKTRLDNRQRSQIAWQAERIPDGFIDLSTSELELEVMQYSHGSFLSPDQPDHATFSTIITADPYLSFTARQQVQKECNTRPLLIDAAAVQAYAMAWPTTLSSERREAVAMIPVLHSLAVVCALGASDMLVTTVA